MGLRILCRIAEKVEKWKEREQKVLFSKLVKMTEKFWLPLDNEYSQFMEHILIF